LDAVCLRALRKEPERCYPTADAFARDLDRHLRGLTVDARPDSRVYRASRFVRRHRTGVVAATFAVLAVVSGAGVAIWQASEARAERDRAEQLADYTFDLFTRQLYDPEAIPIEVSFSELRRLGYLFTFSAARASAELENEDRLRILVSLRNAIAGLPYRTELSHHLEVAQATHTSALEDYGPLSVEAAESGVGLAAAAAPTDLPMADSLLTSAVSTLGRVDRAPANLRGAALLHLGAVRKSMGRQSDADSLLRRSVVSLQSAPVNSSLLSLALRHLADVSFGRDRRREGERFVNRAADMAGAADEALVERSILLAYVAEDAARRRDAPATRRFATEALGLSEQVLRPTNSLILHLRYLVATSVSNPSERSRDLLSVLGGYLATARKEEDVPHIVLAIAQAEYESGNLSSAVDWTMRARDAYSASTQAGTPESSWPTITLARVRLDQGRFADAERLAQQAAGELAEQLGPEHWVTLYTNGLRGIAQIEQGDRAGAATIRRAIPAVEAQGAAQQDKIDRLENAAERFGIDD
ncbi:MAG: hypothetical protein WBA11_18840, partial [Rubrivirga sp.]